MGINNSITIDGVSAKDKKIILIKTGILDYILAIISAILGVICFVLGKSYNGFILFIFAILFMYFGLRYLTGSEQEKNEYVTSWIVNKKIKEYRNTGNNLTKDQISSIRFKYDPVFRKNVTEKIHREEDRRYEKSVKKAQSYLDDLTKEREAMIAKIEKSRWTKYNSFFSYNRIERRALLQGNEIMFSDIKGVKVWDDTKIKYPNKVCNRLSIIVDLKEFEKEIILINKEIATSDEKYKNARTEADGMVKILREISEISAPAKAPKVEEDERVILIDERIYKATLSLLAIKEKRPTYIIPDKYLKEFE